MRKYVLIFSMLLLPAVAYAQPIISFKEVSHDFGSISQNEKVEYLFEFTNSGDQDLIVEKVSGS